MKKISINLFVSRRALLTKFISIILGIFVFLFALTLMGEAFKQTGEVAIQAIINAASNPFIGLFIGLLATALIQSSSTSTSMIVAAVASSSITLVDAVPMIMGANIGTTITSTIVSLSFISKRDEFSRAISASVAHDFFNIFIVLILLPLEFEYGLLTQTAENLSSLFASKTQIGAASNLTPSLFNLSEITNSFLSIVGNTIISLVAAFVLLFLSIKFISKIIYQSLIGESESKVQQFLFNDTWKSFTWGTLITGAIQSSSITTSIIVPFVATGKIKLHKVVPFIIGANIGTTITAFIAVMFESYTAVNIAIIHLIFNITGVVLFLFVGGLRKLLIKLSISFGNLVSRYRIILIVYILVIFFLIPFMLIYFNQ